METPKWRTTVALAMKHIEHGEDWDVLKADVIKLCRHLNNVQSNYITLEQHKQDVTQAFREGLMEQISRSTFPNREKVHSKDYYEAKHKTQE